MVRSNQTNHLPPRARTPMSLFLSRPLRGARVIITGASGGIGRALAREFAGRGARLVLNARRAQELAAVADALRSGGAEVEPVVGDVTNVDVRRAAVAASETRFGGLD